MAASSYSSDVLQRYYGRIDKAIQSLPRPLVPRPVPRFDGFQITQNNFQEWLRVWRMDVPETNPNRRDIFNIFNDRINYKGIDFPTPVRQIGKLEAQNRNLAINVFGWENNHVTVHRVSKKEANVPRINLMLIESGMTQHYCYVKRVSALLFDQTKHECSKHYCMMCLTGFTRAKTAPKPIEMTWKDWENFKNAADCHICKKSLIKDEFLDSLPVWNIEEADEEASGKWSYWGQGHKKCFYQAQQMVVHGLKRLTKKKDQIKQNNKKIASTVKSRYFRKTSETR